MLQFAIQFSLTMLTLMLPSAAIQNPAVGSIEGIVVAAGSSTPVPQATVTVKTTAGKTVGVLTTTPDGLFSLTNVPPGEYRVAALRDGFVSSIRASQVSVAAGRKSGVSLEIISDGVIIGRVVNQDGVPVARVQVTAHTFVQDPRSQRTLSATRSAETNDLGEYRIYWLHPGPYFLSVEESRERKFEFSAVLNSSEPFDRNEMTLRVRRLVPTWFPNSTDVAGASRINLRSGETFSGADIRMSDLTTLEVSGVITNAKALGTFNIQLIARDPILGSRAFDAGVDAAGAFKFQGVVPGAYYLTADESRVDGQHLYAKMPIDVVRSSIEGVSVALTTGFDLRVRLTIEGRSRRSNDPPLVVNLRPSIPSTPFPTVERNGDDELTMRHVMLGDYSVGVLALTNGRSPDGSALNGSLYLKSAQYGGADVLASGLQIDGPPSAVLDILMADGAGSLSGAVLNELRQPVPGVTVVLVPEPNLRGRKDLYKTAVTDNAGKFEISGVAPGQYKAFSWEAAKQGEWQYPDFIEPYEDRGQPIRIDSNRRDPISVSLIPSLY